MITNHRAIAYLTTFETKSGRLPNHLWQYLVDKFERSDIFIFETLEEELKS